MKESQMKWKQKNIMKSNTDQEVQHRIDCFRTGQEIQQGLFKKDMDMSYIP